MSTTDIITLQELPQEMFIKKVTDDSRSIKSSTDLKSLAETNEKSTILNVLQQTRFNKSKAAQLLNIDRKTLYNKMKLYGLEG